LGKKASRHHRARNGTSPQKQTDDRLTGGTLVVFQQYTNDRESYNDIESGKEVVDDDGVGGVAVKLSSN